MGPNPRVAIAVIAVVALQFLAAAATMERPWWMVLLLSYGVGAFLAHFLNVAVHECSHNLVLRGAAANKACAIVANLPGIVPSALAFRYYHLLHHRFLGRRGGDPDVAPEWEVRVIGRGPIGKLAWLLVQPFTYSILHPAQLPLRMPFDAWFAANWLTVGAATLAVAYFLGVSPLAYLVLSVYFAVGPHPTGAHILQEHIIFAGRYETASHYGPINLISMNHGYHVEHHDFPGISGARLPRLNRVAADCYEGRFAHRSRWRAMRDFVFDRRIGIDSRVIHP